MRKNKMNEIQKTNDSLKGIIERASAHRDTLLKLEDKFIINRCEQAKNMVDDSPRDVPQSIFGEFRNKIQDVSELFDDIVRITSRLSKLVESDGPEDCMAKSMAPPYPR